MTLLVQSYMRQGAAAATRTCFFSGHDFIMETAQIPRHVPICDAASRLIAPLTPKDFQESAESANTLVDADLCLILQNEAQASVYLAARRRNGTWEDLTDPRGAKHIDGDSLYGDILGVLSTLIERYDTHDEAA